MEPTVKLTTPPLKSVADVVAKTVNPLVSELAAAQQELAATKAALATALAEAAKFQAEAAKFRGMLGELCPAGHPGAQSLPQPGKSGLDRFCPICKAKWASKKK